MQLSTFGKQTAAAGQFGYRDLLANELLLVGGGDGEGGGGGDAGSDGGTCSAAASDSAASSGDVCATVGVAVTSAVTAACMDATLGLGIVPCAVIGALFGMVATDTCNSLSGGATATADGGSFVNPDLQGAGA